MLKMDDQWMSLSYLTDEGLSGATVEALSNLSLQGHAKVKVIKRNRVFKDGDFQVLMLQKCKNNKSQAAEEVDHVPELLLKKTREQHLPVQQCTLGSDGYLYVFLDRTTVFHSVLNHVTSFGEDYGTKMGPVCGAGTEKSDKGCKRKNVIVNCSFLADSPGGVRGLGWLRGCVVQEHVTLALMANGMTIKPVLYNITKDCQELLNKLSVTMATTCSKHQKTAEEKFNILKSSQYCTEIENSEEPAFGENNRTRKSLNTDGQDLDQGSRTLDEGFTVKKKCNLLKTDIEESKSVNDNSVPNVKDNDQKECDIKARTPDTAIGDQMISDSSEDGTRCSSTELLVDLARYIEEHNLKSGKDGYDANLKYVKVDADCPEVRQISAIYQVLKEAPDSICLHLVTQEQEFTQQQVDLLLKLTQTDGTTLQQIHQVLGQVHIDSSGQDPAVTVQDFIRTREKQVEEACTLKHGDQLTGEEWSNTLHCLLVAAVKFEMLTTACRQQLKLNLKDLSASALQERKGGVFVLYNYARLATMFQSFESSVKKGICPPLPDITDVDFSLLKEEEEWGLLFNYIWNYPDLVESIVQPLQNAQLRVNLHTNKVCQFLTSLAFNFSSYYSRVHVLTEPRPHLLPVMFARLWLLKAVKQVMWNGLKLIGVQPLEEL